MGSSDWLRVYPFEEMCCYCTVLDASSQQCSSALPTPTTHSLTSDERGEGVSSRSRATLCDDAERRDPTSTRSRSRRQHSRSAAMAMACDRLRDTTWPCRCSLSISLRLHSWSWGALSAGPAAGSRINQRQV
jgi:hypothetical protein